MSSDNPPIDVNGLSNRCEAVEGGGERGERRRKRRRRDDNVQVESAQTDIETPGVLGSWKHTPTFFCGIVLDVRVPKYVSKT